MASTVTTIKKKVLIPKEEYTRLKRLERRFGDIVAYFERVSDIREAREQVKSGEIIPQEKLFRSLGI